MSNELDRSTMQDVYDMAGGLAIIRLLKTVAGLLAREACIAQGVDPDKAGEYERAGVRIEYGSPVPDETLGKDGSTILRRALIVIEDKYIFAEAQMFLKPPATRQVSIRAIVGAKEWIEKIDPTGVLPVEWVVDPGEVDSTRKVY